MQRENEDKSVRGYASRKKRYKRRRNMLILILFLVVGIIGSIALYSIYNRSYHGYKLTKSIDIQGETTIGYLSYGSSIIKYGKDGAIAYDKEGKVQWNCSYNMSDPIIDISDSYVVIADRGNKQIKILNHKGTVGEYSTEFNIVKVEIAGKQGVVAALMEEGNKNHIKLYDTDGRVLVEMKTSVKDEDAGYPIDISLSEDGTKFAISYLVVSDGEEFSRVGFYNFSEVGKNKINRYVGGFNCDKGVIASRIEFVNNDTVCIYKNNGFEIYKVKELPKRIKVITTKARIKSVVFNGKYTGMVTEADSKSSKKLLLYNFSGKIVLEKDIDLEYKKITLLHNEILYYDDQTCYVYRKNGKLKFKYSFKGNIAELYPVNGLERYYLVSESKLSVINLKN